MKRTTAFLILLISVTTGLLNAQQHEPMQSPQEGLQGWFPQPSGNTENLEFSTIVSKDTVFASAFRTTNSGNSWSRLPSGVIVQGFIGNKFGYGWNGFGDNLSITSDGGETWTNHNTGISAGVFHFVTPNRGYCIGNNGKPCIGKTTDGGKTWVADSTYIGSLPRRFVSYDSLTTYLVGAEFVANQKFNASLFLTTNGGETWRYASRSYFVDLGFNNLAFLDSTTIIAIGATKFVGKSTDLGYTMKACILGDTEATALMGIAIPNKNNVVVVGEHGKIFRSTDAGATWVRQQSGTIAILNDVKFIDSTTGWIVGEGGLILHTMNGGYSWVQPQLPELPDVHAYPNPAGSEINLTYTLPISQHVTILLLNVAGHIVSTPLSNVVETEGVQSLSIDTHTLPSGTYLLRIQSDQYQSVINCSITH